MLVGTIDQTLNYEQPKLAQSHKKKTSTGKQTISVSDVYCILLHDIPDTIYYKHNYHNTISNEDRVILISESEVEVAMTSLTRKPIIMW